MGVLIESIACYIPSVPYSADLINKRDVDLAAKLGISTKFKAGREQTSSDLVLNAVDALQQKLPLSDVDMIIACSQTNDNQLPGIASLVAKTLPQVVRTIDLNLGCSGFVQALEVAQAVINAGKISQVLIVTADTYSKLIADEDRHLALLFGDGASATLVRKSVYSQNLRFVGGTDSSGYHDLVVNNGRLYMDGARILELVLRHVPQAFEELMTAQDITKNEVDYVVFHQANKFVLETLRRKLDLRDDQIVIALENAGNTTSTSIPIALGRLMESLRNARDPHDKTIVLMGFGVGFSWAGTVLRMNSSTQYLEV